MPPMVRYGPLRDARNPLQRAFVRWKLAAPIFFGSALSGFLVFLFAFPAARGEVSWLAVVAIGAASLLLGITVMLFADGQYKSTREQRGARWAPYMPWFKQKAGSAADPGEQAQYVAGRRQPRKGTVSLSGACNAMRRLAVEHLIVASVIGGALVGGAGIAAPIWSRSILWGLVITVAGAVVGLVLSFRSDLRRMTSDERAKHQVTEHQPRNRRHSESNEGDRPTTNM